jgi:hypothetical protein
MKAKGFYDVPLQGWEGQMQKYQGLRRMGPVLVRETAAGPELQCKLAESTVGASLQGLRRCCWCCREWVSWQFVTSACAPQSF